MLEINFRDLFNSGGHKHYGKSEDKLLHGFLLIGSEFEELVSSIGIMILIAHSFFKRYCSLFCQSTNE